MTDKLINRKSGILLHPTALPGSYGIGDLGPQAYKFIDDLVEMNQSQWQVLPLGPTDSSNSPYSLLSVFAGNHQWISFDLLYEDGFLNDEPKNRLPDFNQNKVEFSKILNVRMKILNEVCHNFKDRPNPKFLIDFEQFKDQNQYWLDDYAQFWAFRTFNGPESTWINWKTPDKNYLYSESENCKILQFLFHDQWKRLKSYANDNGIKIIGDMPIYAGFESADVWKNRHLFQLDENGHMIKQAGCPPCDYQKSGQLWGNPLYQWDAHEKLDFSWWKSRFRKLFEMVDRVRLDHFIGYSKYWSVPMFDNSAKKGWWNKSPGESLFNLLLLEKDRLNLIAEDLGAVDKEVITLRQKFKFPGMRVLQFEMNDFSLSKIFEQNSVVYTGTHDNDTLVGWLRMNGYEESLLEKFNCTNVDLPWSIIQYALESEADTVIIPLQDILGLGSSARFNTPGTVSDKNWSWRYSIDNLTKEIKQKMRSLTYQSKRGIKNKMDEKISREKNNLDYIKI